MYNKNLIRITNIIYTDNDVQTDKQHWTNIETDWYNNVQGQTNLEHYEYDRTLKRVQLNYIIPRDMWYGCTPYIIMMYK